MNGEVFVSYDVEGEKVDNIQVELNKVGKYLSRSCACGVTLPMSSATPGSL